MKSQLVVVKRRIRDCDVLRGKIVLESDDWLVLNRLDDSVFFDGYVAMRTKDVKSVSAASGFESRALELLGHRAVKPRWLKSFDVPQMVREVSARSGLVTFHQEVRKPNSCDIGTVDGVDEKFVAIRRVRRDGSVEEDVTRIPFARLTRVEWGGLYEAALLAVIRAG